MSAATDARAAALEILLAHFPNVPFLLRDLERSYAAEVARELPNAMSELRERLESELRRLQITADPINTSSRIKD
jgi:hypothetical protein